MGFHVTTERKRAIRVPKRAGTEKPAFLEHGVSIGKHDNSKGAYGDVENPDEFGPLPYLYHNPLPTPR